MTPLSIVTPASSTKGNYATEAVLTSRSSATKSTPSRNYEQWLAVFLCGYSGRGRNRASSTKGNYATEAVLTSRSSATKSTPSRNYEQWLAVFLCGYSGRGRNRVPHRRCTGTGNSIWSSRITSTKATITVPSGKDWKSRTPQDESTSRREAPVHVLTSRSSATKSTPSRNYEQWLAVFSCGYSGRGRNRVPHRRCTGTGNSIWSSRITSTKATITVPSGKDWKSRTPQKLRYLP